MGFWEDFAKNPPTYNAQTRPTDRGQEKERKAADSLPAKPKPAAAVICPLSAGKPGRSKSDDVKSPEHSVRPRLRSRKRKSAADSPARLDQPKWAMTQEVDSLCRSALEALKGQFGGVKDTLMLQLTPESPNESIVLTKALNETQDSPGAIKKPRKTVRKSARKLKKSALWREQQRAQAAMKDMWSQKQKQNACKFFLSGKCQKGSSCPFRHRGLMTPLCDTILRNVTGKGGNSVVRQQLCVVEGCPYIHDLKQFPCVYFHSKDQICTKAAESCRFSHKKLLSSADVEKLKYIRSVINQPKLKESPRKAAVKLKPPTRVGVGKGNSSILSRLAP